MTKFSFDGAEYETHRVIGEVGHGDGPTVVFIGGMHGNEPTGVIAIQQALRTLEENKGLLSGRVIGLSGNLEALGQGQRLIEQDLNRLWDQSFLRSWNELGGGPRKQAPLSAEEKQRAELYKQIEPLLKDPKFSRNRNASPQLYFADLHTTSAKSVPFIGINDQLDNRRYALSFPVPTVLGIEEYISGALLSLLNDEGHVAMAFEAGQHDDPMSVEVHRAFIFCALHHAGVIPQTMATESFQVLERAGRSMRGIFEVVYKRSVTPADNFKMEPGYKNFLPITKGERLATDQNGEVRAGQNGRIFMPLYQKHGNDGYFVVRRVPRWALWLSRILRKINFDTLLTLLPGVSRSKTQSDTLVVNKRVARILAVQLFHLLGYRRKQDDGNLMIVSRREIEKPD